MLTKYFMLFALRRLLRELSRAVRLLKRLPADRGLAFMIYSPVITNDPRTDHSSTRYVITGLNKMTLTRRQYMAKLQLILIYS